MLQTKEVVMTRTKRLRSQAEIALALLIATCALCTTTSRGQTPPSPVASGDAGKSASSVATLPSEEFVRQFSELVIQRLSASDASLYLGKSDLSELQADMERFVKNRVPPHLSNEQTATIRAGAVVFIDRTLGNASRSDFPNAWENLKWRVAGVLLAGPLTKDEQRQLREQLDYVRRYVKGNAASFRQTPQRGVNESLRLLDSFSDDPFLPCFKTPLNQTEWRKYCVDLTRIAKDCAKLPADAAKPDVLEIMVGELTAVRPPTKKMPRYMKITADGPLIEFPHTRSFYTLGCFAYDNPRTMSRTTFRISEPEALDIGGADRASDRRGRQPSAMTIEEATALAKKLKGDLLYSDKSNELIGVDGTEFAMIYKNSVGECVSLSDKVIQALLNAIGKTRFSLRDYKNRNGVFKTDVFLRSGDPFPEPPRGLFLAVRDNKGCMGILHIRAMWSTDSNTGREHGAGIGADFYRYPKASWGLGEGDYSPNGDMRQRGSAVDQDEKAKRGLTLKGR
jgi:hypothetical protein